MARVELSQVDKIFDDGTHVVHGLDLDVADHEFLVLVGPSGCGKSTTLRMVAGLETVTAGTIRIDGNVVNEVAPKDRDIAMVFQSYALYPHMTVRENLTFALRLRKLERRVIDERVARVAEVLGITPLLARTPKQLSGGQRQRVAVGRAIVRDPKCFLFDEPLSNLDAKLRLEMRAELRQLHQRLGTTTIYVTHDQEEAITLGDRVVVMHAGVLQQCAPPLEIYRRPVNRFVAGFFGSPPMNFLEGQLVEKDGTLGFESAGARLLVPTELRARLAGHAGRGVVLGIRPECLSTASGARFPTGDSNRLEAEVSLVQPLGDRMNLYLNAANGTTLVAQIDAESGVKVGQPYPVHVDMARVHFFELGEPGRNLSLS